MFLTMHLADSIKNDADSTPDICCAVSKPWPTGSAAGGCKEAPGSLLSSTSLASTVTAGCADSWAEDTAAGSFFGLLCSADACLACRCSSRSLQKEAERSLILVMIAWVSLRVLGQNMQPNYTM